LRFAPLDLDVLRTAIADDLGDAAASGIEVDAGLGVTCLDQIVQAPTSSNQRS
jgi:hypothetical protein